MFDQAWSAGVETAARAFALDSSVVAGLKVAAIRPDRILARGRRLLFGNGVRYLKEIADGRAFAPGGTARAAFDPRRDFTGRRPGHISTGAFPYVNAAMTYGFPLATTALAYPYTDDKGGLVGAAVGGSLGGTLGSPAGIVGSLAGGAAGTMVGRGIGRLVSSLTPSTPTRSSVNADLATNPADLY